jgi:hypothetical protein
MEIQKIEDGELAARVAAVPPMVLVEGVPHRIELPDLRTVSRVQATPTT